MVVRHRQDRPCRRAADRGGDVLYPDRKHRNEHDFVERHLHANPPPHSRDLGADSIRPLGGQPRFQFRQFLRVKRRLNCLLTFDLCGSERCLGECNLFGCQFGLAFGPKDRHLALELRLACRRAREIKLRVRSRARCGRLSRVKHNQGALGHLCLELGVRGSIGVAHLGALKLKAQG